MPLNPSLTPSGFLQNKPMVPGLFMPHKRSIGGIVAHVTIEEVERDEVTVTQHPVEQGAPISDHAFKQQEEVILRVGWNLQDGDLSAESGIYGIILNWQASFVLFDLVTGKRIHSNMLMTSVVNTTDSTSEYALLLTISCREIILTRTQATNVTSQSPKTPEDNASTEDRGSQQINTVSNDQHIALINGGVGNFDDLSNQQLTQPAQVQGMDEYEILLYNQLHQGDSGFGPTNQELGFP